MAEPVNRDELQTLVHNGAHLVDLLGSEAYGHAHVPAATDMDTAPSVES